MDTKKVELSSTDIWIPLGPRSCYGNVRITRESSSSGRLAKVEVVEMPSRLTVFIGYVHGHEKEQLVVNNAPTTQLITLIIGKRGPLDHNVLIK